MPRISSFYGIVIAMTTATITLRTSTIRRAEAGCRHSSAAVSSYTSSDEAVPAGAMEHKCSISTL